MTHMCKIILAVQFFALVCGVPIEEAEDVGTVEKINGQRVVSGHIYPYVAYIKIISSFTGEKRHLQTCAGVIIGKKTVLTAAHCLYGEENSHVIVQVGIIDTNVEKLDGQNIIAKDRLIHELYQKKCRVRNNRFCLNLHDIAILWLEFDIKLGPKVQIATLGQSRPKPFHKEGWILGWGLTKTKKVPSMLQRGLVKVMTEAECKAYNPSTFIIKSVICLKSAKGKTRTSDGDSGGPFVINEVVYGISSLSVYETDRFLDWIDAYTYVPLYTAWIRENQQAGPPKSRETSSSTNRSPKFERKQ